MQRINIQHIKKCTESQEDEGFYRNKFIIMRICKWITICSSLCETKLRLITLLKGQNSPILKAAERHVIPRWKPETLDLKGSLQFRRVLIRELSLLHLLSYWAYPKLVFFLIECTGMTMVPQNIQISSVQFNKTLPAHGIVRSLPQARTLKLVLKPKNGPRLSGSDFCLWL